LCVAGGWKAESLIQTQEPHEQPIGCPDPATEHYATHKNLIGVRDCWIYSPITNQWSKKDDMNYQPGHENEAKGVGRWYPTLLTLGSGAVLAIAGHPDETDLRIDPSSNCLIHNNNSLERYSPSVDKWFLPSTEVANSNYYPRLHLLPTGKVFFSSTVSNNSIFSAGNI
jgi:hypothetical protein